MKKSIKPNWSTILLTIIISFGLTSCQDKDDIDSNNKESIIGNWLYEEIENDGYLLDLYSFYNNGTFKHEYYEERYPSTTSSGEDGGIYSFSSGKLTLDWQRNNGYNEVEEFQCNIIKDDMIWTSSQGNKKYLYRINHDNLLNNE